MAALYMWVLALALAKCSVCVMLLHIFGHNKPFRITSKSPECFSRKCLGAISHLSVYSTLGLTVGWLLMNFMMAVLNCKPVSYNWDKSIPGGTCDNVMATFLVTTILDIAVDLILALAPMPFIWRLKQTTRVKTALTLLFALTLFDMVLGVIRGWARVQGSIAGSWAAPGFCSTLSWFVGLMEPGVAIIIACLILMRPLLDVIAPREWLLLAFSKEYRSTHGKSSREGPSSGSDDPATAAARARGGTGQQRVDSYEKNFLTYSPAHTDLTFERNCSADSRATREAMYTCPDKILVRREVIVK